MTKRKTLWLTFVAFALFIIPAMQARAIDESGPASENLLPKYILVLTILIAAIVGVRAYRKEAKRKKGEEDQRRE